MHIITQKKWNKIPKDYKGCWANKNDKELYGKRYCFAVFITDNPKSTLSFEGLDFLIKKI